MTRFRRSAWLATVAALVVGCGPGTARHHPASGAVHLSRSYMPSTWPPLPTAGYISGRVATAADVAAGNAVFAACVGVVGHPLRVAIPQYALWRDSATDSVVPVVVVEAEFFGGDSMFGVRRIASGTDAMAAAADLELLGQTPPGPVAGHPEVRGVRPRRPHAA